MTVEARKSSVESLQIATHEGVIKMGGSEGPLPVASAALRSQRICVNIVLSMAIGAKASGAGELSTLRVAARARDIIVRSF